MKKFQIMQFPDNEMNIDKSFLKLASQSLAESIDRTSMVHLAREVVSDYSLHEANNLPKSVDTPRIDTARKLVHDMYDLKMLIPFLNVFFSIQFKGYKGRKYKISRLRNLIIQLYDMGFSFDSQTGHLYEDPQFRISRNWGVLQEGHTYAFSFLWCDIVKSSIHVKKNNSIAVKKFYKNYNDIVRACVESRNGRIWHIEGDGILAAFHFGDYMEKVVYTAIEILHRIHNYNRFENKLSEPVQIRISCNKGTCEYSENHEDIKKSDQIMKTILAESYTEPDTITVNLNLSGSLSGVLQQVMTTRKTASHEEIDTYAVEWE